MVRPAREHLPGELVRLCKEDGVDLVLAQEAMAGEFPLRPDAKLYAAFADIARENGFAAINPGDAVREKEVDHFVWWDTAHYAPYGHHLFASLLEPVVAETVRARMDASPLE